MKTDLPWIDLEKKKTYLSTFIEATILAGADSVPLLMGTTYLGQFRDLEGEFATNPIFRPDFLVGRVPYSKRLLAAFNDVSSRLTLNPQIDGQGLKVHTEENTKSTVNNFLKNGAQLARLYLANKNILEEFPEEPERRRRRLFEIVDECYLRDKKLAESFKYLSRP